MVIVKKQVFKWLLLQCIVTLFSTLWKIFIIFVTIVLIITVRADVQQRIMELEKYWILLKDIHLGIVKKVAADQCVVASAASGMTATITVLRSMLVMLMQTTGSERKSEPEGG